MSETLRECPCCLNNAALHDRGTGDSQVWWVECSVCGLRTSMEEAAEYAVEVWHRRASAPSSETGVERERLAALANEWERQAVEWDDDEFDRERFTGVTVLTGCVQQLRALLRPPLSTPTPDEEMKE